MLLLTAGCLCGFSQDDGFIPVNKNLWSTSFILVASGGGLVGLGITYVLVDIFSLWSGAPLKYLGMNSIMVYCCHGVLQSYFPFSYDIANVPTHYERLQMEFIGASIWLAVSYYCHEIDFFIKV